VRYEDELKQVALVIERLTTRNPDLPRAVVESAVRDAHAQYADSHVRDFVPLLVERGARAALRAHRPPTRQVG
jgi:hypothetical protein